MRLQIPDGPKALALARWAAEKGIAIELDLLPPEPEPVYPPGYPRICQNFHEITGPQDERLIGGRGNWGCRFCRREMENRRNQRKRAALAAERASK